MNEKILFAALIIIFFFIAGCPIPIPSTPPSPPEKWSEMQLKLTYIGPQEKIVSSIGISVKEFDLSKFQDKTPGIHYDNDELALKTIKISEEEMKKTVNNVFALDFIENTETSGRSVSFTYYNATSSTVKEFLLNEEQAKTLASTIQNSLTTSSSQAASLQIYS